MFQRWFQFLTLAPCRRIVTRFAMCAVSACAVRFLLAVALPCTGPVLALETEPGAGFLQRSEHHVVRTTTVLALFRAYLFPIGKPNIAAQAK